ncbi:MAG: cysteine-rich small domain-containing protein [Oscillospiraceae bacterium]|nr:cysteine-rich small domain-containing protein [Oscillospiraceae bacterium]
MSGRHGYEFFQNKSCEFFPCHAAENTESFNCLFCYCPLYALGKDCGGRYVYLENGVKDCSHCLLPHSEGGYEHIQSKFKDIVRLMRKNENNK